MEWLWAEGGGGGWWRLSECGLRFRADRLENGIVEHATP